MLKGYAVIVSISLALVLGCTFWLMTVLNADPPAIKVKDTSEKGTVVLPPKLVAGAISDKSTDDMKLTLKDNKLLIDQQSTFLSLNIETNILTTPVAIGDNRLRLNIEEIEIAGLKLSERQKLNLVRQFADLPDGVELDVKNKCFYYQLEPIELSGLQLILTDIDQSGWHFKIEEE
ncbi:DUF2140 family protein [Macrococcus brunensis]|uniref:DUF2140 family protein n=1 Tax=Macrococcus brunensis TaxID=198483 RepID=A0A4R6BCP2_9STAP|nr:DUF2140 family protein [Macrococcus brunensis]TDL95574.1 DUF2140 family protein [Macrococcus brunensis]ULG70980.1 DUF2140 family protein [Macrococcus brunensis]ULG73317.1 DUF2140 family protein [Macrococcus brunensis]